MNQIIDIQAKGHLLRLYVGANGDQYGDDWDDAPYEHNAGPVYDKFVERYVDVVIPFDYHLEEPSSYSLNYGYLKYEQFIKGSIPRFQIYREELGELVLPIYFGDDVDKIADKIKDL